MRCGCGFNTTPPFLSFCLGKQGKTERAEMLQMEKYTVFGSLFGYEFSIQWQPWITVLGNIREQIHNLSIVRDIGVYECTYFSYEGDDDE